MDIHSHSDYYLVFEPMALSRIYQGVTTEIGGNCGYSAAPVYGTVLDERRQHYFEQFQLKHKWDSVKTYFNHLSSKGISLNYGHLVGSNTVRASIAGFGSNMPGETELKKYALW
ncbi:MAG: hypothetical protein ACE5FU_14305 [Nitrospinota bacterium]